MAVQGDIKFRSKEKLGMFGFKNWLVNGCSVDKIRMRMVCVCKE